MTQERVTQTEDAQGNTHTTHVIRDDKQTGGSGVTSWAFLLVLVAALAVGGYLLARSTGAEMARDNAIADAAGDVGDAAGEVGKAAGEVGDAAGEFAERAAPR